MYVKRLKQFTCGLAMLLGIAGAVMAQGSYPTKAVKLIVPLAAGGATDVVARIFAAKLGERLGQQVIVENRPGAEGLIGVDAAVKAAPDGYTLVLGSSTTLAANFHLRKTLPFHPVKDLEPVSMAFQGFFNILVINAAVPAKNLQEFIALAKSQPGKLDYGTATSGSKICVETFKVMAGIDLQMVNYKSSPQALNDLMGGQLQLICEPVATAMPNILAGRLRSLGVTSATPHPAAPNLATVAQEGLPGFEYSAWVGVFAPAQTPAAVIGRLEKDIAWVLNDPDTIKKVQAAGVEPMPGDAKALAKLLNAEIERAGNVVKAAKLQPE
ncbi:Bordetella uptake gene [Burkholderiaceae bacterium]|jgi:tripartite-type tricarboxylate transporter receptor subunit TctC